MFVRKGKGSHVTLVPAQVLQSLLGLRFPCLLEHRRSQIDTYRVPDNTRKRASQQPGSAGNIERRIFGAAFRHLDDPVQRFLIADCLRLRERNCLARELVEDAGAVVHERNVKRSFSEITSAGVFNWTARVPSTLPKLARLPNIAGIVAWL